MFTKGIGPKNRFNQGTKVKENGSEKPFLSLQAADNQLCFLCSYIPITRQTRPVPSFLSYFSKRVGKGEKYRNVYVFFSAQTWKDTQGTSNALACDGVRGREGVDEDGFLLFQYCAM
jgi:hypothetical protein